MNTQASPETKPSPEGQPTLSPVHRFLKNLAPAPISIVEFVAIWMGAGFLSLFLMIRSFSIALSPNLDILGVFPWDMGTPVGMLSLGLIGLLVLMPTVGWWLKRGRPVFMPALCTALGVGLAMALMLTAFGAVSSREERFVFREYDRLVEIVNPGFHLRGSDDDRSDVWHDRNGWVIADRRGSWCAHAAPKIDRFTDLTEMPMLTGVRTAAFMGQNLRGTLWNAGCMSDGEFLNGGHDLYRRALKATNFPGNAFWKVVEGEGMLLDLTKLTPRRLCELSINQHRQMRDEIPYEPYQKICKDEFQGTGEATLSDLNHIHQRLKSATPSAVATQDG